MDAIGKTLERIYDPGPFVNRDGWSIGLDEPERCWRFETFYEKWRMLRLGVLPPRR
jgi:hypothetical protein